jgi:hypothetical protein
MIKQRMDGRVCIVTGAGQGIGRAAAERLVAEGAVVYGFDLAPPTDPGEGIHWIACDVTNLDRWGEAVAEVIDAAGPLDVLINNAGGVGSYDPLDQISVADWDRVVTLNQSSVFYGLRTVLPGMLERGKGAIVNVSSMWGLIGAPGVAAYQASKGAVTMITKNAAATYAGRGIRVNSVHPGFIWTPMTRAQDADLSQGLINQTPMQRAGEAEEVAAAIAFLASDDAGFITGQQLVVDGGFTTV